MKLVMRSVITLFVIRAVMRSVRSFSECRASCSTVVVISTRVSILQRGRQRYFDCILGMLHYDIVVLFLRVYQVLGKLQYRLAQFSLHICDGPVLDVLEGQVLWALREVLESYPVCSSSVRRGWFGSDYSSTLCAVALR